MKLERAIAIAVGLLVGSAIAPIEPAVSRNGQYALIEIFTASQTTAIQICQSAARQRGLIVGWMEHHPRLHKYNCYLRPPNWRNPKTQQ